MPQSTRVCTGVASGFKERGRGRAWAGTGRWVERDIAGRWLDVDWGCRVAVVQERGGVGASARFASGITHPLCPSAKGQGEERGRVKRHQRERVAS
jgi:hypothetical protein